MSRRQAVFVAASLLVGACSSGASTSAPTAIPSPTAAFPLTLVDDDGISVTLAAPPARIVTFAPSITEILFALGLGDRIVGVSGPYDDHPAAAADIPEVGGAGDFGVDPNLETVVGLEPDLFLTIAGGDAWKQRLRDLGVGVVGGDRLVFVAEGLLDHQLHVLGDVGKTLFDLLRFGPDPAGDEQLVVVGEVHESGEVLAEAEWVDDRESGLAGGHARGDPQRQAAAERDGESGSRGLIPTLF